MAEVRLGRGPGSLCSILASSRPRSAGVTSRLGTRRNRSQNCGVAESDEHASGSARRAHEIFDRTRQVIKRTP